MCVSVCAPTYQRYIRGKAIILTSVARNAGMQRWANGDEVRTAQEEMRYYVLTVSSPR